MVSGYLDDDMEDGSKLLALEQSPVRLPTSSLSVPYLILWQKVVRGRRCILQRWATNSFI
jgi:hypothetical protein